MNNCPKDVLSSSSFCFRLSLGPGFLLLYFNFKKICISVPLSFETNPSPRPGFNICIFSHCLIAPILTKFRWSEGKAVNIRQLCPPVLHNAVRRSTRSNARAAGQVFIPLPSTSQDQPPQSLRIASWSSLAVHSSDCMLHKQHGQVFFNVF